MRKLFRCMGVTWMLMVIWAASVIFFPATQAMADGPASLRIRTGDEGLYWLGYDDLQGAGVPVDAIAPADLAMSYLGQSIDILIEDGGDGRLDPGDGIVFYAEH
jgi:hypothetical protein